MKKANIFVMTLAGLLLIVAAGLKFHEMIATCVPSWQDNPTGFWESYEFFLIQIPLEFALGVWLVSGLFRKASWIVGTLAYFAFILVTIFKIVTGAESCGCFGQITVNPRITLFVMDIPIFLLLAIFRPKNCKLFPPPWPNVFHMLAVAVPVLAVMALAAPAMVTFRPDCIKVEAKPDVDIALRLELSKVKQELQQQNQHTQKLQQQLLAEQQKNQQTDTEPGVIDPTLNDSQNIENEKPVTDVEPQADQSVTVEQWDWLEFVVEDDIRQQISEGLVIVMMHRYDCPTCEEMAPQYSEYYKEMTEQGVDEFKIAFLSIPPYGDEDHVPDDTTCIAGTLTDEKKWGLMSPLVVALLDGELIKTWEPGTAPEPDNILEEVFGQ